MLSPTFLQFAYFGICQHSKFHCTQLSLCTFACIHIYAYTFMRTYTCTHTGCIVTHTTHADIQLKAITDHSTAEPLRILHTAKTTIHYVAALVTGGVSVYSEQHKCTSKTPGTNWMKNSWCLGEVSNYIKYNDCFVRSSFCKQEETDMKMLYWFRGSCSRNLVSCVLTVTSC